ncbi:MAG: hypothetical protein OEY23_16595, partial [Acidimicrobiia bacterium]|nr:hypothetical protein [Acidimicrobiia bacterium]
MPGSSLDPGDVIGRDDAILSAVGQMRNGSSLLLSDPRRMGKTALLDRLCNHPGVGLTAVKIDYEGVHSQEEFFRRTVSGLRAHQRIRERVEQAVGPYVEFEGKLGPVKIKAAFAAKPANALLVDVIGSVDARIDAGELVVIAMDEVPLAVGGIVDAEGPAAARQLLEALRQLRRKNPSSIRWIVTGSIGFHHVLRRCGSTEGVINDLVNLPLGRSP